MKYQSATIYSWIANSITINIMKITRLGFTLTKIIKQHLHFQTLPLKIPEPMEIWQITNFKWLSNTDKTCNNIATIYSRPSNNEHKILENKLFVLFWQDYYSRRRVVIYDMTYQLVTLVSVSDLLALEFLTPINSLF